MGRTINLGDSLNDARYTSPAQALNDALERIGEEGAFKKGKKLLIICLDDSEDDYYISWIQAGMRMSECVALCECTKSMFKEEMGY